MCVCVCQSGISPTYTTYRSLLSDASETLAGWALFGPDALDSIKLDRSGQDGLLRWYSFSPGDPKLHVPVWMSVFLPLLGSSFHLFPQIFSVIPTDIYGHLRISFDAVSEKKGWPWPGRLEVCQGPKKSTCWNRRSHWRKLWDPGWFSEGRKAAEYRERL